MAFLPVDMDSYFEPIGSTIHAFCDERGLVLEKYYRDAPLWSICFAHPLGGNAKLDVVAESDQEVSINPVWWLDDYSSFTRSLKWGIGRRIGREPQSVRVALDEGLTEILGWRLGEWPEVAGGYRPIWSRSSPEEFAKMANPWPPPRLH